ncbi:alpha/beta hydrolase [Macromonas nakdongensis]|uniref:alpha/beta hydrolase n=1 Tax=Macromonas nakdongensis TaxID=1843082 RepID=UPI000C3365E3|nr:alpha/beta fold hydrolase [Macromonas nakdongensis]
MNAQTESLLIDGPSGALELAIDRPAQARAEGGVAVIAHPHPLFGGTLQNKVVQTLARAYVQAGWTALRFNFRGVGRSAGVHDHGVGETEDLLAAVAAQAPAGPLALAGFSFGAFVTCQAAVRLQPARALHSLVLVGTAASRFAVPALPEELHDRTLVVHGEQDDTVALSAVLDWARPQALPVTVIPGVEHFFHGRLPLLKALTLRHLRAA